MGRDRGHSRRSRERSGAAAFLLGAVPVAVAIGILLLAIWRWRANDERRLSSFGGSSARLPIEPDAPDRLDSHEPATAPGDGRLRPRGRIEDVLARAREQQDAE